MKSLPWLRYWMFHHSKFHHSNSIPSDHWQSYFLSLYASLHFQELYVNGLIIQDVFLSDFLCSAWLFWDTSILLDARWLVFFLARYFSITWKYQLMDLQVISGFCLSWVKALKTFVCRSFVLRNLEVWDYWVLRQECLNFLRNFWDKDLSTSQRPHLQLTSHWALNGFQHMNLGVTQILRH